MPEAPGQTPTDAIADDLRDLEILIVLDSCEHVVGACVLLFRKALSAAGERNFPIPPLSLPDPARLRTFEGLAEYEAILNDARSQLGEDVWEATQGAARNSPAVPEERNYQ